MSLSNPAPTFRDPAGSVSFRGDSVVRTIHPAARQAVLDFVASSFCSRMQQRGDLVEATIDDGESGLMLLHPRVPVPTYPWEWTPSQWLAAGELTLDLGEQALDKGWILKDATPLNILFIGSRPILVDILSFERYQPGTSIWLAYGQYMRTFLLPLVMNQLLSWPLALSIFKRDGYEPAELYAALGWRQRMSRSALWPITLPAWFEKRKRSDAAPPAARKMEPEVAAHVLRRTLGNLRWRTQRALPKEISSDWAEYQSTLTHYSAEQSTQKRDWVTEVLKESQPGRVLDIGANTGEYSALAASLGAEVVALERDGPAADRLFRMSRARNLSIQTIHADLARPTPAVGWLNRESSDLLSRLEGQFELVMMLAVIHHLILMEQIPIPQIVALCHRLTRSHLIVEWVPVEDPMYQSLMRGRGDLYGGLTEQHLLDACAGLFQAARRQPLENGRVLFLFAKTPAGKAV